MKCLFQDFKGWSLGVITSSPYFEESLGATAERTKALKAGNLDTVFYMFDELGKESAKKNQKGKDWRAVRKDSAKKGKKEAERY